MELPQPPYGCPDTPGRECMLRHLYAKRHSHAVSCSTCSPMAAKVAEAKEARAQAKNMTSRMLRAERQRKYEEVRKERRKAASNTPEKIAMKLEFARRKEARRQAENEAKRVNRALEKAARLAAMTQEDKDALEKAKLDQRRANLDKARVAMLAKREAEKAARLIRPHRRGNQNQLSLLEATCAT